MFERLKGTRAIIFDMRGYPYGTAWSIVPVPQPAFAAFTAFSGEEVPDPQALATFTRSHGLDIADALIAAAASTSGLRLWTLNRRHYPMRDLHFWEPVKS